MNKGIGEKERCHKFVNNVSMQLLHIKHVGSNFFLQTRVRYRVAPEAMTTW